MLSSRRSPVSESHQTGNATIATKRNQILRLNRGWRCGTNDALLKLPSLSTDSATRFFRTVSFRLTTHSVKSHKNSSKKALTGGGGFPSKIDHTTSPGETGNVSTTGNDQATSSGEIHIGLRTGNDQTGAFPTRSQSVAAFFRRVNPGHQMLKVEHTKRTKDDDALRGRPVQRARITSGQDEADSGGKRNSFFHRMGSIRIQNRNSVNYKSLEGGSRPADVDTVRNSFRQKLQKNCPTLLTKEFYRGGTVRPPRPPRTTRGAVSDGEEEEEEDDSQGSERQQNRSFKFQRSSPLWRSFSAKSRTRSNDVLLDATESGDHDLGSRQREDIERELDHLSDFQRHRHLAGFQHLLPSRHRRIVGPLEQDASLNIPSPIDDASSLCSSPSTQTKVVGPKDWKRFRHILDDLYEFNVAHAHYTEAAFVLCEHAQLSGSAEGGFKDEKDWRRWEQLLLRAVEDFDLGRTWEYAIDICEYLSKMYKARFMYAELSLLLQKQADLYRKILQEPRAKPCYFMIHFLGGDFPEVLRNKRFVLRTEKHEDEYDLNGVISNEFKGARQLYDNSDLRQIIMKGIQRGYKLFKLKPVPSVSVSNPGSRKVPDAVQFFHRYNNVFCFEVEGQLKSVVSIESSLPAVSRWAQVRS